MSHELEKLTPYLWRRGPNYLHWCQGCKCGHVYPTKRINGPNWSFDGNIEAPTFMPSMLIFSPAHFDGEFHHPQESICHYHVIKGSIQYQPDCRHDLKSTTHPLQAIPDDYGF